MPHGRPRREDEDKKSRPKNNFHCFEGAGYGYWRAYAQGFSPFDDLAWGRDGARWEVRTDADGYAVQNGGLANPQETKINPGFYYRFFGTIPYNTKGADGPDGGMSRPWWIDYENLLKVVNFAEACDYSLARAAGMLLAVPGEWQDCGYLGCAILQTQMKAFVGKGKPAAARISPASAGRDPSTDPVTLSPAHLEVKQYCVPGSRTEIASAFVLQWVKHVIKPGVRIF